MPRDKIILAAESIVVAYVLYQVVSTVYNHLKAKDRLKRKSKYFRFFFYLFSFSFLLVVKLFYKDNVD
jgi:hypothetical protein